MTDGKILESKIIDAEEIAKEFKEHSVAEFFKKNKQMLGLYGKVRTLTTVVHEYVTNSLDACEEANILPEIDVKIEEISPEYYEVTVKDNGPGLTQNTVGKALGQLLAGTKFHRMMQSRGQQGIGSAGCTMLSQTTTGKPSRVITGTGKGKPISLEITIDPKKNQPKISNLKELNRDFRGLAVQAKFKRVLYRDSEQGPLEYLRRTAIANPHAQIRFTDPTEQKILFKRSAAAIPKPPATVKPHPKGVTVDEIVTLSKYTDSRKVSSFLRSDFDRMGQKSLEEISKRVSFDLNKDPKQLRWDEAEEIVKAFKETDFIAPSAEALRPIGEQRIGKSLENIVEPEFLTVLTRKPQVYAGGFPFQVECCTGDTKLVLENGEIVPIKEYVEKQMFERKVFSMNNKLKIVPSKVNAIHRFKNTRQILKIMTKSGRSLKITENNKMPVINQGKIEWRRADRVKESEFLAVPRRQDIEGTAPKILDLLDEKEVKIVDPILLRDITEILKEKYGNYKTAAEKTGIDYETLKKFKSSRRPTYLEFKKMVKFAGINLYDLKERISKIRVVDNKYTNPVAVNLPQINEDFLYVLGLINSDGFLSRREIQFINKDQKLHQLFKNKTEKLFGIKVHQYKPVVSSFSNKTIYLILRKIEEALPTLPKELIISWLQGYADGDGWIKLRKNKIIGTVGFATAKRSKAELVQTLLLRLGILSKIVVQKPSNTFGFIENRKVKTLKTKHNVEIRDFDNIEKFCDLIGFRQTKRQKKLELRKKSENKPTNAQDVLPLGKSLKELRKSNNLFQYQLGFSDQTIRQTEKGYQNMSRKNIQEMLLKRELNKTNELALLAFSDLLCDKIVKIEVEPEEEFVYDLTVETGNFVANNMIMHNCAIAYGGKAGRTVQGTEGQEKRLEIMRFANRAPLLFDAGNCAITKAVHSVDWKRYDIRDIDNAPVTVLVNFISVYVPYTGTGKQAIADEAEVLEEIRLSLMQSGRKAGRYISTKRKEAERQMKRELFYKYIPEIVGALHAITKENKDTLDKKLRKMVLLKLKLDDEKQAEEMKNELEENGAIEKPKEKKEKGEKDAEKKEKGKAKKKN